MKFKINLTQEYIMPTLTPAYGRDYKSAAEALKAYKDGKDFVLNDVTSRWNGAYCSVRDNLPGPIFLRYNKLQDIIEVPHG